MAIPLPNPPKPGGGLLEALNAGNEYQIGNAQAKYAPYNAYADALSKQAYARYLPYQIQAQVMSNPLLALAFKDHPEKFAEMMENFSQSIPSGNSLGGDFGIPIPGQTGNGILKMLLGKMTGKGGNAMAQGMPEQSASNNALTLPASYPGAPSGVPAGASNALNPGLGGTAAGAIGATTAPLVKSPFISAPTVPNAQGGLTQAPTAETIAGTQKAIQAAKRVDPILNHLFRDFVDPYTIKNMYKIGSGVLGHIVGASDETLKKFGTDKNAYSRLIKFRNNVDKSVIDLMGVYGIHQEEGMNKRIANILELQPGESKEGYFDRVKSEIDDLRTQQSINEGTATSGFSVNPQEQPSQVVPPPAYMNNESNEEGSSLPSKTVKALQDTASQHKTSVPMVIQELSKSKSGRKWLKDNGVQ